MKHGTKAVEGATKSDWDRVRREADRDLPVPFDPEVDPYDPNDEEAVTAYWTTATIRRGPGRPRVAIPRPTLNMRVDADVLAAFKATGPGWQTRIHALLREAVQRGLPRG